MDLRSYHSLALRTAKPMPTKAEDIAHAALGLTTEFFEARTATTLHGVSEELADLMWYVVLACESLKANVADVVHPEHETTRDWLDSGPGFSGSINKVVGDFVTFAKRVWVYEKKPTPEMLAEVASDLSCIAHWIAAQCRVQGLDFEMVLDNNIAKLRKRFPNAYSDQAAEGRADKGGLDARSS